MSKLFGIGILLFLFFGCQTTNWSYFYPYSNSNPEKFYEHFPKDYEECLNQFDTILKKEAISYFKKQDHIIAPIEISQAIGGLFINFWHLDFYRESTYQSSTIHFSKGYNSKPLALEKFRKDGISDPEEMIRVLFTCYHKRLNNVSYNWTEEIERIHATWIPAKVGEGWVSPKMKEAEREIIANYRFNELAINDTVDIYYNRVPSVAKNSPRWYYVTGLIKYTLPEEKRINIQLIDVKSEYEKKYIQLESDTLFIGGTITEYYKGWLKRGVYYFNYRSNKEYRE